MLTTNDTDKMSLQSSIDSSSDEMCWFICLPYEIFEMILNFLNRKDINLLSQTCSKFYTLLNDDKFWNYLIYRDFPKSIAQFYTIDLFQKPEIVETHNEIRQSDFLHRRQNDQIDILAINSATHYDDEVINERHAKMYVSKDNFVNNVEFFQFKQFNKSLQVPFNKIIYFYLIDRKRCAATNMNIAHLDRYNVVEELHSDSLIGRIIHLCSKRSLDISGRFEHRIMPGKYEVSWRMKADVCGIHIWGITEFIVVPQYGKLLNYRIHEDDFYNPILQHQDCWWIIKMGQTIIYEPSTVLVAIRNWDNHERKYGLLCDCIELTLVA
ncbi:unnamed protein product [Rotaria magnacalcarata]|uniref:F-box domain-containing protein n=1 Tax=Rotaria magnacalcarata TaxID=392030 RepID=A0A819ELQ2_9BILA|nr:unnamed protein product [Rotaria magnacalcarata]CAF3852813.1 unnamed protein product [Rotaria magnacalcarata]